MVPSHSQTGTDPRRNTPGRPNRLLHGIEKRRSVSASGEGNWFEIPFLTALTLEKRRSVSASGEGNWLEPRFLVALTLEKRRSVSASGEGNWLELRFLTALTLTPTTS
jgi:hypothetical protein